MGTAQRLNSDTDARRVSKSFPPSGNQRISHICAGGKSAGSKIDRVSPESSERTRRPLRVRYARCLPSGEIADAGIQSSGGFAVICLCLSAAGGPDEFVRHLNHARPIATTQAISPTAVSAANLRFG